jgi:hypothetical protein
MDIFCFFFDFVIIKLRFFHDNKKNEEKRESEIKLA